MSKDVLRITNLRLGFRQREGVNPVIAGMNLSIRAGETVALLGESGCGKSLTALSVMGLTPGGAEFDARSRIYWHETDLLAMPEVSQREIRGRRISMIFQEPMTSLNPVMTIEEQIHEVLNTHFGKTRKQSRPRIIELLDAVGIPAPEQRMQQYPHQLSGGMKQRVMIAMALAGEPELLIADEPTTALDVTVQAQVLALLKRLQRQLGMAILLITHDLGIVNAIADKVAVMYAGHVVELAPRQDFFNNPQHPYSQKLFDSLPEMAKRHQALSIIPGQVPPLSNVLSMCRFADRCQYAWSSCRAQLPKWIATEEGHRVRCHRFDDKVEQAKSDVPVEEDAIAIQPKVSSGRTALSIEQLKVHFPLRHGFLQRTYATVKAVDDISLQLTQGETLAIVGESGCGKTTAALAVLQLIPETAGRVVYQQRALSSLKRREMHAVRRDLQIVFQDPFSSMNPRMMVFDIIAEGIKSLGMLKKHADVIKRVDQLLLEVGLPENSKYRYPHEFSGGQRQRIAIARALAVEPKIIICDEPTSALDVSVQAQILNLLRRLQQERGITYLFITHNIAVVSYLADNIAVMYLGKIVESGPVESILKSPKHPYTQALMQAVPSLDKPPEAILKSIEGELPSPINPPSGCYFHPRCPRAMPQCRIRYPYTTELTKQHQVNCYLYNNEETVAASNVVTLKRNQEAS